MEDYINFSSELELMKYRQILEYKKRLDRIIGESFNKKLRDYELDLNENFGKTFSKEDKRIISMREEGESEVDQEKRENKAINLIYCECVKKQILDLKSEYIQNITDVFTMFDTESTGTLNAKQFTFVLKALGYDVTWHNSLKLIEKARAIQLGEEEEEENEEDENEILKKHISLSEFIFLNFEKPKLEIYDRVAADLSKAFKTMDKEGKGYISTQILSHNMMKCGDKLSESEVNLMIKEADPKGLDKINYEEFIDIITQYV